MAIHRWDQPAMVDRKHGQRQLPANGETQRKMPDRNRREHGRRCQCRAADRQRRKFAALATDIDQPIRKEEERHETNEKKRNKRKFRGFRLFRFFSFVSCLSSSSLTANSRAWESSAHYEDYPDFAT